MRQHRLHREIVTTVVVNTFVDTAGITCFHRLSSETGADAAELLRAHIAARTLFGAADLEAAIAGLDHAVSADTQTRMRLAVRTLVERATRWLVNERPRPLDISATVAELGPGVRAVLDALPGALGAREADGRGRAGGGAARRPGCRRRWRFPVAALPAGFGALPAVTIAAAEGLDPTLVARVHLGLAQQLGLDRLMIRITALPREDRWSTMARAALRDDLHTAHARLTAQVVARGAVPGAAAQDPAGAADALVHAWERATPDVVAARGDAALGADRDHRPGQGLGGPPRGPGPGRGLTPPPPPRPTLLSESGRSGLLLGPKRPPERPLSGWEGSGW